MTPPWRLPRRKLPTSSGRMAKRSTGLSPISDTTSRPSTLLKGIFSAKISCIEASSFSSASLLWATLSTYLPQA